jgi:phosphoribosylformylglycinamidine synthase I
VKVGDVRVCVLRIEGTNCEEESLNAFRRLGADAEHVHLKQLEGAVASAGASRSLEDYHILFIPGGFSAGDYVRAGAIFASRMRSSIGRELAAFIEAGKPVGGVCNGFQVLVELGALPGFEGPVSDSPHAVLTTNDSNRFECRPTLVKVESKRSPWTQGYRAGQVIQVPSAHAEGKLAFPQDRETEFLESLRDADQVMFRWVDPSGAYAGYPYNPNGSVDNIAGICNPAGNVLGLMPHPERVFFRTRMTDWTRAEQAGAVGRSDNGPGRPFFQGVLDYAKAKL